MTPSHFPRFMWTREATIDEIVGRLGRPGYWSLPPSRHSSQDGTGGLQVPVSFAPTRRHRWSRPEDGPHRPVGADVSPRVGRAAPSTRQDAHLTKLQFHDDDDGRRDTWVDGWVLGSPRRKD